MQIRQPLCKMVSSNISETNQVRILKTGISYGFHGQRMQ